MEKIRIHMGRMNNSYGTDVTTIIDDPVKPQYRHDTVIKILMYNLDFTPMEEDHNDSCEGFYDEGVKAYFDYDGYIDVDIPQSIIERICAEK